jgi:Flp pilus assembly protein TadG
VSRLRSVLPRAVRRAAGSRPDEDGTATAFVIGFAIVLLACAGLVIDGGTALNARMKLADDVEQAARTGAQQIDLPYLRANDAVRLEPVGAETAAENYLGSIGYSDYDAQVVPDATGRLSSVRVVAQDTVPVTMLALIGVPPFDIRASATAEAVTQ